MTPRPSTPSQTPPLNGMPRGVASGEPSPPTGVREKGGKRGGEAEAVGEHVLGAGGAELVAEEGVAVQHLPQDRLRRRRVDVALFPRRTGRETASGADPRAQPLVVGREVLLDHAVA